MNASMWPVVGRKMSPRGSLGFASSANFRSYDAGVNIITDTGASIDPIQKVTFSAKDMTLSSVLTWITRATGLQWCLQDEAVFVTTYERLSESARRQIEARDATQRAKAPKTWLPAMQDALAQKISVEYGEKPIADCRTALAKQLGINIILSSAVSPKAPITLSLTRMTAESVLSWVVRQAGVDFAVLDEAVYIAPSEEIRLKRAAGLDFSSAAKVNDLVSFSFTDTPLDKALADLSQKSGVRIVLQGAVSPMPLVTLSAADMPLTDALRAVLSRTDLNMAVLASGDLLTVTIVEPMPPAPVEVKPAVPSPEPAPQPAAPAPAAPASTDSTLEMPVPETPAVPSPSVTP